MSKGARATEITVSKLSSDVAIDQHYKILSFERTQKLLSSWLRLFGTHSISYRNEMLNQ